MLFHDCAIPQNIELVTKPLLEIKTQDKIIEIILEITLILMIRSITQKMLTTIPHTSAYPTTLNNMMTTTRRTS
ncbi:hypothetical protein Stok01_00505 [Sulfurisphaera tokodaii]